MFVVQSVVRLFTFVASTAHYQPCVSDNYNILSNVGFMAVLRYTNRASNIICYLRCTYYSIIR